MGLIRLFDWYKGWDYGWDVYLILGQFKKFNLFEATFSQSMCMDWEPNVSLRVSLFSGSVFSFRIEIYSLVFYCDFITYRCPMDLLYTRE
jgi:hypothetical protein